MSNDDPNPTNVASIITTAGLAVGTVIAADPTVAAGCAAVAVVSGVVAVFTAGGDKKHHSDFSGAKQILGVQPGARSLTVAARLPRTQLTPQFG